MSKLISKADLKGMRIPIVLMTMVIVVFFYTTLTGYRLLDIFGSSEWERDGPGVHNHVSGSHYYYHK